MYLFKLLVRFLLLIIPILLVSLNLQSHAASYTIGMPTESQRQQLGFERLEQVPVIEILPSEVADLDDWDGAFDDEIGQMPIAGFESVRITQVEARCVDAGADIYRFAAQVKYSHPLAVREVHLLVIGNIRPSQDSLAVLPEQVSEVGRAPATTGIESLFQAARIDEPVSQPLFVVPGDVFTSYGLEQYFVLNFDHLRPVCH